MANLTKDECRKLYKETELPKRDYLAERALINQHLIENFHRRHQENFDHPKNQRYSEVVSIEEIVPTLGICQLVERDDLKGYRITKFFKKDGTITYERFKKIEEEFN